MTFNIDDFKNNNVKGGGLLTSNFTVHITAKNEVLLPSYNIDKIDIMSVKNISGIFNIIENNDASINTILHKYLNYPCELKVLYYNKSGDNVGSFRGNIEITDYMINLDWNDTNKLLTYKVMFKGIK